MYCVILLRICVRLCFLFSFFVCVLRVHLPVIFIFFPDILSVFLCIYIFLCVFLCTCFFSVCYCLSILFSFFVYSYFLCVFIYIFSCVCQRFRLSRVFVFAFILECLCLLSCVSVYFVCVFLLIGHFRVYFFCVCMCAQCILGLYQYTFVIYVDTLVDFFSSAHVCV